MTSILLVKTSSLGDVVHNLPVISDIRRNVPGAAIDWLVEQSYEAIPRLHPGVRTVIPVNVRRWRTGWWRADTRADIHMAIARLQANHYDAIIDTQGLMKSALVARAAHGPRYGLDWHSAREPLGWFYDRTFRVPWTLHAVERNRELVAQALGYRRSSAIDYGVQSHRGAVRTRSPYAVLLHSTSARAKLWREDDWVAVAQRLAASQMQVVLPWGNTAERARSERLASAMTNAAVPDRLPLDAAAKLLAGAALVIGLDTGLTHLAGAFGVPTVALYIATDPAATGLYGCPRGINLGGKRRAPSTGEVMQAVSDLLSVA